MMDEARTHHRAMFVVGVLFLGGFLTIALATVVSVVSDDLPEPARISALGLSADLEVVDAHQTCSPEACDGEGAVLTTDGVAPKAALDDIEVVLQGRGWRVGECGDLERCLRWHDLGVELALWTAVRDDAATAAMRANLDGMSIDQAGLVYLRVFRCDVVIAC